MTNRNILTAEQSRAEQSRAEQSRAEADSVFFATQKSEKATR